MTTDTQRDGIILLAKKPGITSFTALNSVKKALNTSKVGHTGTLDSFAEGLLVVCTGRLTKLAGNITEFDKTYDAVIKFGEETDTLDYTGTIVKKASLPSKEALQEAVEAFRGPLMQEPPSFSAIHVNGKRASDLAREGQTTAIPPRPIQVYESEIRDLLFSKDDDKKVSFALIRFTVSKGTYIRSLARDIAKAAGSAAHLVGLFRSRIGNFSIENAAGFSSLENFSISSAIKTMEKELQKENIVAEKKDWKNDEAENVLKEEIRRKILSFNEESAKLCGFALLHTIDDEAVMQFKNGRPLRSNLFDISLHSLLNKSTASVFTKGGCFIGLIAKDDKGRVSYRFVLN